MLALIFANGVFTAPADLPDLLAEAGLIIAADGGANHCAGLGLVPDLLIGDLDSTAPEILHNLQAKGVVVHRHPPAKDATDLELALDLALARGAATVRLLAALGGRWDMSLGNILLAAHEKYRAMRISLTGEHCLLHLIHPGEPFAVRPSRPGSKVSLLPLKGDVHGLTLQGFQYPLANASVPFGSSRGISNVLVEAEGVVQLAQGLLLCVCLDNE